MTEHARARLVLTKTKPPRVPVLLAMTKHAWLPMVVAMTALAGCGQKGPLVLPDGAQSGAEATPAPSSADDEDERANDGRDGTESRGDGR